MFAFSRRKCREVGGTMDDGSVSSEASAGTTRFFGKIRLVLVNKAVSMLGHNRLSRVIGKYTMRQEEVL